MNGSGHSDRSAERERYLAPPGGLEGVCGGLGD